MNALVTYPKFKGTPGYMVFAYEAGTTSAIDTYSDWLCTIKNSWPVVLDNNGEAVIYVNQSAKLVYTTDTGDTANPVWSFDNYFVAQQNLVDGVTTPGTTDNLYQVTSSPAQTALFDQLLLIMTPDVDSATTTSSQTFSGTGQNDAVFYGPYTGSTSGSVFTVQIDSTGTPDTFQWKKDGGAWTTGVAITGGIRILINGVTIKFARVSGHTVNDLWALTVQLPVKVNLDGLGAKIGYKNVEGSGLVALGAGDLKAHYPAMWIYSLSADAYVLTNPAAPSLTSPAPSRVRREVVGAYAVTIDDAGNEVSVTTGPVTLPAAADFANQFVYLQGVGPITISSVNSEKIYLAYDTTGATSISIGGTGYDTIQLMSDSIGWHILATVTAPHGIQVMTNAGTIVCPGGVTTFYATGCAGGGGGGGGVAGGSGGGAGQQAVKLPVTVVPGITYTATIGAAGTGGAGDGTAGTETKLITGVTTVLDLTGGSKGLTGGTVGAGGSTVFGSGGASGNPGANATGFGSGGGGGTAGASGGNGSVGELILEW